MLNIDQLLTVLSFGLACLSIGFAIGFAMGRIDRQKQQ